MVGTTRDDDLDVVDSTSDDVLLNETLTRKGEDGASKRRSRRTLEEIMEQRRLKRQLRDVFADDDWDD